MHTYSTNYDVALIERKKEKKTRLSLSVPGTIFLDKKSHRKDKIGARNSIIFKTVLKKKNKKRKEVAILDLKNSNKMSCACLNMKSVCIIVSTQMGFV